MKENKDKMLKVRLSKTELEELKIKAKANNTTMSDYVRQSLAKLKIINIVKSDNGETE